MSIYNESLTGRQVGDDYEWTYYVQGDSASDCNTAKSAKFSDEWGSWQVADRPIAPPLGGPAGGPLGPLIYYMAGKYILIMVWVKTFYTP